MTFTIVCRCPTSPEKFSEMIRDESARWGKLVREYNVKVD
jgi:hypothetical protein